MDYLQTLGQVLREVRVAAGLSREACAPVLNRDHLAKVEQGRQAITVLKFRSLCDYLSISHSLVLTAVEARLAGVELEAYRLAQANEFSRQVLIGKLSSEVNIAASQGVRGKQAADSRMAVQTLQIQGYSKMEIVRNLGVSRSTVDRYWVKA
ncbi:helix-turn-helix domain-containing protein [Pseudomonas quasicaspiana]|uniref:helix-turn-helix domain-containing protein n=1 Tax=Pseudomonas quasicaspiana TaxID=2829821 RepID=UPI001E2FA719|nr:helix-turn-helix domain-containing protein [Pseudomonas quasicaspiana]MCD5969941.1 helix-turn-helix domain-containing protein [Pseudomonas quasicaspiana]